MHRTALALCAFLSLFAVPAFAGGGAQLVMGVYDEAGSTQLSENGIPRIPVGHQVGVVFEWDGEVPAMNDMTYHAAVSGGDEGVLVKNGNGWRGVKPGLICLTGTAASKTALFTSTSTSWVLITPKDVLTVTVTPLGVNYVRMGISNVVPNSTAQLVKLTTTATATTFNFLIESLDSRKRSSFTLPRGYAYDQTRGTLLWWRRGDGVWMSQRIADAPGHTINLRDIPGGETIHVDITLRQIAIPPLTIATEVTNPTYGETRTDVRFTIRNVSGRTVAGNFVFGINAGTFTLRVTEPGISVTNSDVRIPRSEDIIQGFWVTQGGVRKEVTPSNFGDLRMTPGEVVTMQVTTVPDGGRG